MRLKLPLLLGAGLLSASAGMAQSFALSGLLPAPNASAAPRAIRVGATFSQPVSSSAGNGALKLFSQQRGGQVAGATVVSGNTLTLSKPGNFKPGETVQGTLTMAAQSSSGSSLAGPRVFQFTTAVEGGTGVFGGGAEVPAANTPTGTAVADVDGDGDLDLLAANSGSNSVSVRLNNGRGVFSAGPELPVGESPLGVAAADVDGDGDLDLLAANSYSASGGPASVSVRLNNGSGGFSVPAVAANGTVAAGRYVQEVATADVDGDGDLDLLAVNYVFNPGGAVSVQLNNGAGVFSGGSTVAVDSGSLGLALGDLDNDGDVDLATANFFNGTVSLRYNDGRGSFSGSTDLIAGQGAQRVALADLNADGYLDMLVALNRLQGAVNVRLNDGRGNFGSGTDVAVGFSAISVAAADVDGDGDLDFLATARDSRTVAVRINNGSGQFSGGSDVAVAGQPSILAAGDLDGDGDLDFLTSVALTSTPGALSIRFNNGTGAPLAARPADEGKLTFSPNPARHAALLQLPAGLGAARATLYDALGRAVRTQPVAGTSVELDLRGLAAGLYQVRVQAGEQQLSQRLVVE